MEIEETALRDVLLLRPRRIADARGFFSEIFRKDRFEEAAGRHDFVQDNLSMSNRRWTVRGLHFQCPPQAQGKLVTCLKGAVLDVAVDIRSGSPSFGRHVALELSSDSGAWLWIPPGFAHGFCTLTEGAEVLYKVTGYYSHPHDKGLAFDDPALGIAWPMPVAEAILSDKDRRQPRLAELPAFFSA